MCIRDRPESGCRSVEELVRLGQKYLREHALSEGQWMLGMGYDNGVFPGDAHPTRFDLDRISEEIPMAVTHVSGHLCAVNSRAMEILGYDGPDPQVPEGGEVDPSGPVSYTHLDVYKRQEKRCPLYFVDHEDAWEDFLADVKKARKDMRK